MSEQSFSEEAERLWRRRWQLLGHLIALTERPMTFLSFVWLGLLILDLTRGLPRPLAVLSNVIWVIFGVDFVLEFLIAPQKWRYLRRNWPTALALVLPAFRILRVFRAFRILRFGRAVRSLNLVRLLTSLNRGLRAVRRSMAHRGVGYVVALTLVVLFGGAAGMQAFENPRSLRDAGYPRLADAGGGINGYGEAVWWTTMILTTMGSDYWPRTPEGRILCALLAVYGFAVFGYLAATVASYFVGKDQGKPPPKAAEKKAESDLAALAREVAEMRRTLATLALTNGQHDHVAPRSPAEPPASDLAAHVD